MINFPPFLGPKIPILKNGVMRKLVNSRTKFVLYPHDQTLIFDCRVKQSQEIATLDDNIQIE